MVRASRTAGSWGREKRSFSSRSNSSLSTLVLRPPFNTPLLYANPLVFPIIQQILGRDCILGGFGAVFSLPGAPNQNVHRDFPGLFDRSVDILIPSFAINLIVPLVELNDLNGTTRVWTGSHIASERAEESVDCEESDCQAASPGKPACDGVLPRTAGTVIRLQYPSDPVLCLPSIRIRAPSVWPPCG